MTDPIDPPVLTREQRRWALSIISRRHQIVHIVSGEVMLRNAAKVLGGDHVELMEQYLRSHRQKMIDAGEFDPPGAA